MQYLPTTTTCPKLLGDAIFVQFHRCCLNWYLHSDVAKLTPSPTATIASGAARHISRWRAVKPGTRPQITSAPSDTTLTLQTLKQKKKQVQWCHSACSSYKITMYVIFHSCQYNDQFTSAFQVVLSLLFLSCIQICCKQSYMSKIKSFLS